MDVLRAANDAARAVADALLRARWADLAPLGRAVLGLATAWCLLPWFLAPALPRAWLWVQRALGLVAAGFVALTVWHLCRLALLDLRFRRVMGGDGNDRHG